MVAISPFFRQAGESAAPSDTLPAAAAAAPPAAPRPEMPSSSLDLAPVGHDPDAPPLPDLLREAPKPWQHAAVMRLMANLMARGQWVTGTMRRWYTLMWGNHSTASALAQRSGVLGERRSSYFQLLGNGAAMPVSLLLTGIGTSILTKQPVGAQAVVGTVLKHLGEGVRSFSSSLVSCIDTNSAFVGGKYRADQERIQRAVLDHLVQVARGPENTFQTGSEAAKRAVQSIEELLQRTREQEFQLKSTISRNI